MMQRLREMNLADADEVARIEHEVHAHPWTHGNFTDALASDCICKVYEADGEMLGYIVLKPALDEMELLDISIAAAQQRKGLGRKLLGEALAIARAMGMRRLLLEVRPSNTAALALYRSTGFTQIGLRRGYYPAAPARGTPVGAPLLRNDPTADNNGREDAIVMECLL